MYREVSKFIIKERTYKKLSNGNENEWKYFIDNTEITESEYWNGLFSR